TLQLTTSTGWSATGRVTTDEGPLPAAVRNSLSLATVPLQNALLTVRINNIGGPARGRGHRDGPVSITGVFRASRANVVGVPDGWMTKEIRYGGREIGGKALEAGDGSEASGIEVVLTKRLTAVSGEVADANGAVPANGTVLFFAADSERWFLRTPYV